MNRARLENETFEQYRANQKKRQKVLNQRMRPKYLWFSYQGTAIRNPRRFLDSTEPHYTAA